MAKNRKKKSGKGDSPKEKKTGRLKNKKKNKTTKKRKGEKTPASNPGRDSAAVAATPATAAPSPDTPAAMEPADTFDPPSGYPLLSGFWFRIGVMVVVILMGIAIFSNGVDQPENEVVDTEPSQHAPAASTPDSTAWPVSDHAGPSADVEAATVTALPATDTGEPDSEKHVPAGQSEATETEITMPDNELPQAVLTDQLQQYRPLAPEGPGREAEQPAPAATGHRTPPQYPAGGYPYRSGRYAYPPAPYYPGYPR